MTMYKNSSIKGRRNGSGSQVGSPMCDSMHPRVWQRCAEIVNKKMHTCHNGRGKLLGNLGTKSISCRRARISSKIITFTYVCEFCKLLRVEDFLWWGSTNHGERRKKNTVSGWWYGACGQPCGWRKANERSARWRV